MLIAECREEAVFNTARKLEGGARFDYLQLACGDDVCLCQRVLALLDAHEQDQAFLSSPAALIVFEEDRFAEVVLGPYRLVEQIGEGGFGLVFLAEQERPVRRRLAVKVLKPGMDTRQIIARFEAERQVLALMDHPNIAKVFDAGETPSGRPYIAMELARGVSITEYCSQKKLDFRARLELFLTVCQAVQHAHLKGIIHRDLKPSNILVTMQDGKPVVKVIDFGIAKAVCQQLTDKTLSTRAGQTMGTPLYMSPEQADQNAHDVDTRTDVYALGVLLYELLTGTTPFDADRLRAASYDEIRRIIREEEPPRPSVRLEGRPSQFVKRELDWIVMQALEKDRARRYDSVNALAADVRRYLNDEPVSACPPSAWYRFGKFARRYKTALLTTGLVSLALLAATAISIRQAALLSDQEKATRRELQHTREAEEKATRELFESLAAQAHANRLSNRLGQRFETLEVVKNAAGLARQLKLPPSKFLDLRNQAIAALALPDMRMTGEAPETDCIGTWFDAALERYACVDRQHIIHVRRSRDAAEIFTLGNVGCDKLTIEFSPDGRFLAVFEAAPTLLQVWRLDGAEPVRVLKEPALAEGMGISPDSGRIALQLPDRSIGIFDLESGEPLQRLPAESRIHCFAFNPRGGQLALASRYRYPVRAKVIDLDTEKILWQTAVDRVDHQAVNPWVAWNADGQTLAVGDNDAIALWDVGRNECLGKLPGHTGGNVVFAFSPMGDLLASSGDAGILSLWDPLTFRQVFRTHIHAATLRFAPDGRSLVVTDVDNRSRIWAVDSGREYRTLAARRRADQRRCWCSVACPDDNLLAAGVDGGIRFWDLNSRRESGFVELSTSLLNYVALAPGKDRALLTMGATGLFRRPFTRDSASGPVVMGEPRILLRQGWITGLSQSRDGRVLATALTPGPLVLLAERPDEPIALGNHAVAWRVAVSPDGRWAASGRRDGPGGARVWDVAARRLAADLPVGLGCQVAFSPDGKYLITAAGGTIAADLRLRRWQVGSWIEAPFAEPVQGEVPTFSPDGKFLVVETGSGVARFLDPATGQEYARFEDPNQDRSIHFAFTPDGTKLIGATRDGCCLHVWDIRAIRRRLAELGLDWV